MARARRCLHGCSAVSAGLQVRVFGTRGRLGMNVDRESGCVLQVEHGASLHAVCARTHCARDIRTRTAAAARAGLSAHSQGVQVGWVIVAVNGSSVTAANVVPTILRAIDARTDIEIIFRTECGASVGANSIVAQQQQPPVQVCDRQRPQRTRSGGGARRSALVVLQVVEVAASESEVTLVLAADADAAATKAEAVRDARSSDGAAAYPSKWSMRIRMSLCLVLGAAALALTIGWSYAWYAVAHPSTLLRTLLLLCRRRRRMEPEWWVHCAAPNGTGCASAWTPHSAPPAPTRAAGGNSALGHTPRGSQPGLGRWFQRRTAPTS